MLSSDLHPRIHGGQSARAVIFRTMTNSPRCPRPRPTRPPVRPDRVGGAMRVGGRRRRGSREREKQFRGERGEGANKSRGCRRGASEVSNPEANAGSVVVHKYSLRAFGAIAPVRSSPPRPGGVEDGHRNPVCRSIPDLMHHQPFIAANRAGRHCQALTLPRPLEKGFLKVLGFIFLVFDAGRGPAGA